MILPQCSIPTMNCRHVVYDAGMKKVVIASNSTGKLREFAELLKAFDFTAIPQRELGVTETEEPYATFIENALIKARHAAWATGLPAIADDSGICVPALGGTPGVLSARYAGEPRDDARNSAKLVAAMEGVTNRRAFYYAAIVFLTHADDPHPLIADGAWHGEIVAEPRGSGGFGYDAHFFLPQYGCTAAELPAEVKIRESHRGIAIGELQRKLTQFQP
jgi:XTP/dITP diphosphohydrolase